MGQLKATYKCKVCGKETHKGTSKMNIYCSNTCQGKERRHNKVLEWKSGKHVDKSVIKRYLQETTGNFCYVCGIGDWNGKTIVLDLEHIDGNSDNNREENVALICPNCHSQTSTYKGRNKGNGRHARRERYAEGQSY